MCLAPNFGGQEPRKKEKQNEKNTKINFIDIL
jgi:hypothetical protein